MTSTTWTRVTQQHPCPICGKPDWCTVGDKVVCCMRVESPHTLKNGGWAHGMDARPIGFRVARPLAPTPTNFLDAATLITRWLRLTTQDALQRFAGDLGLPASTLRYLNAAWADQHAAWAFPMQDGQGNIVGIRLRSSDGRKWAVKGSRQGIFVPAVPPQDVCWICEGPTDTAAALSLGVYAVGRPSCTGGVKEIIGLTIRTRIRRLVIVADNDKAGKRGAWHLADEIRLPWKMLYLPAKDLRDYVQAGATYAVINSQLKDVVWTLK